MIIFKNIFKGDVMKKMMLDILIIAMINLVGCYYQEQMSPANYDFAEDSDIQVTTKDTVYNLKATDYYYYNDSLFVRASQNLNKQTKFKYQVVIPAEDIQKLETKRADVGGTMIIIGVLALVTLGIAFLVSLSNMD
jgi:hypothetical protein